MGNWAVLISDSRPLRVKYATGTLATDYLMVSEAIGGYSIIRGDTWV